jgi:hypothetical protein
MKVLRNHLVKTTWAFNQLTLAQQDDIINSINEFYENSDADVLHNCEACGHEEIDHDGECWHGLVEGKRCACRQYVPDASN